MFYAYKLPIVLAFLLQFGAQFGDAKPANQLGFPCTNESNPQKYGCHVPGNVLRFFVIGDIGGEEYETSDADGGDTVAEQHQQQCTVQGDGTVTDDTKRCHTVMVKKHRPTTAQKAVANAMHLLATEGEMAPHFLLNVGDNFYKNGVTFADVEKRFEENFAKVYHHDSLNVPWYTIAGNNDWKSPEKILPQIQYPTGKWTFPAQHYVVHYEFGEVKKPKSARFIMIDTTVLCGSGSSVFQKTKKKSAEKYAEMIANAKKHFKWLRKEFREAKRRRVNFLFLVGHCPLHILDNFNNARIYPCARRVTALMRYFQVQAYFAGHEHNLKYVDLSGRGDNGIRTKYIVSGAGSRMENAIYEGRFPQEYLDKGYMKFLYPMDVGKRTKVEGEVSKARGVLDGGAFVSVEIDAKKMVGKLNFYAAGMLYQENSEKVQIEKWHKFEGKEVELLERKIDESDKNKFEFYYENGNICHEFLALANDMADDEHFQMDLTEQIQTKLGTYFCVNLRENEKNWPQKSGKKHSKGNKIKFEWTTMDDEMEYYAEEAMDAMRKKFEITHKKLADSFLADDLVELSVLGKSSSKFYRTKDEKFLLKHIPKSYEVETIEKTMKNYVEHMTEAEESFINKIFLIFRLKIENTPTVFLLMENVFESAKDVPLLTFDVKGVFSRQHNLVEVEPTQRLNDVVLKWYNYFGAEPALVPRKVRPMFKEGILLDHGTHRNIAERLRNDFTVLAKNNVNDWSIIFGVHFEKDEGDQKSIAQNFGGKLSYFNATCDQCRTHPNSDQFLNNQKLRLFIGIVDTFTPFSDERKKRYISGLKKHINVENEEDADLMDYVKKGRIWETFGPIPPPMYGDRMLAFSMTCAFRWRQSGPAANGAPEAIRQSLISAFCDSYGNVRQMDETLELMKTAQKPKNWMDSMQNKYRIGKYEVTVFAVELFKHLMEQSGKFFWNFLTDLADDQLETEGENFVHKNREKFVVKKLSDETVKAYKKSFEKIGQEKQKVYALLSLNDLESDQKKAEQFFEVIGTDEPMELDQ